VNTVKTTITKHPWDCKNKLVKCGTCIQCQIDSGKRNILGVDLLISDNQ